MTLKTAILHHLVRHTLLVENVARDNAQAFCKDNVEDTIV